MGSVALTLLRFDQNRPIVLVLVLVIVIVIVIELRYRWENDHGSTLFCVFCAFLRQIPLSTIDLPLYEQLPDLDPADIYAEGDGEDVGESYSDTLRVFGGPPEIAHVGAGDRDSSTECATRIQPRATPHKR